MIKECNTTAEMSIIINGSLTKSFHIERGLHQSGPLSPFLFILITDVLNWLISKVEEKGPIKGLSIGKDQVKLSHL